MVELATSHVLIVSEDGGNSRAYDEAGRQLHTGGTVTWICSTPRSSQLVELEQMAALKNTFMHKLNLMVITRNEQQPFEVLTGSLDPKRLQECAGTLFRPEAITSCVVACGQETEADVLGWAEAEFPSVKALTVPQQNSSDPASTSDQHPGSAKQIAVTVVMLGREHSFQMDEASGTLLDGAELAGIDLPYSCRGGVCSTCRTKLRQGQVRLLENYALEDWELEAGFTLPCQAQPLSAEITLDYDET